MNHCVMFHHAGDNKLLETCVKTLRKVSDCFIIIYTDNVCQDTQQFFQSLYGVEWRMVDPLMVEDRMMGCKVECYSNYCFSLGDNEEVLIADTDLYFLEDPFDAFNEYNEIGVGLSLRFYNYWAPINGGVVYYKISDKVRNFLRFQLDQIKKVTWPKLIKFQKKYHHTDINWWIDQDLLCVVWNNRKEVETRFGLKIVGVDSKYNYCPGWTVFGREKVKEMILTAYENKSVSVLHLKSCLKELITDGLLK